MVEHARNIDLGFTLTIATKWYTRLVDQKYKPMEFESVLLAIIRGLEAAVLAERLRSVAPGIARGW